MADPRGPHGCQMLQLTCWQQLPQGYRAALRPLATDVRIQEEVRTAGSRSAGSGRFNQACKMASTVVLPASHQGSLPRACGALPLPTCALTASLLQSSRLDLHGSQLCPLLTCAWSPHPPLEPQPCSLALTPHLPTSWGSSLGLSFRLLYLGAPVPCHSS